MLGNRSPKRVPASSKAQNKARQLQRKVAYSASGVCAGALLASRRFCTKTQNVRRGWRRCHVGNPIDDPAPLDLQRFPTHFTRQMSPELALQAQPAIGVSAVLHGLLHEKLFQSRPRCYSARRCGDTLARHSSGTLIGKKHMNSAAIGEL